MNPGYLLAVLGQVRAGSFVPAFLPWTLALACNPIVRNVRWPERRP